MEVNTACMYREIMCLISDSLEPLLVTLWKGLGIKVNVAHTRLCAHIVSLETAFFSWCSNANVATVDLRQILSTEH